MLRFSRLPGPFLFLLCLGAAATAAGADAAAPATLSGAALISHLNESIQWYRQVDEDKQWLAQPSDVFFWNRQRDLAAQAVRLAFVGANAELPLVAPAAPQKLSDAKSQAIANQAKIANLAASRADRVRKLQMDMASLDGQIAKAAPDGKASLAARRSALQAEANLFKAMEDALQKVGDIMTAQAQGTGANTLAGQVDALQKIFDGVSAAGAPPTVPSLDTNGLIKQTLALIKLLRSLKTVDRLVAETLQLQGLTVGIQTPIRAIMRDITRIGDKSADQVAGANPRQLPGIEQRLASISTEFTQLAAVTIPLRQELLIHDQSLENLQRWREAVAQLYQKVLWSLFTRAGAILVGIAAVFGISGFWRRMTLRYVQDEERRRQFLLVRRVVTGALMITVIFLGFVSDFGSLATIAGMITAGLAVALQSIILSMVAYFFMIGRSGLRAGDRVTIAGVTGDVMHVGPVRFYVKELAGDDLHPTGRMAIFSNAVIFQHNPVFRPITEEKSPR